MSLKSNFQNFGVPSGYISKVSGYIGNVNKTYILIILTGVLCIIGSIVYYYKVIVPRNKYETSSNVESMGKNGESSNAELMLFSVDWCPHCKTAKPIWEELKTEYKNKTINGYTVLFTDVNCTTETPEIEKMISNYKIEGYPTIKLLKDGQVIDYDAKPSKDTLSQFLNTVL